RTLAHGSGDRAIGRSRASSRDRRVRNGTLEAQTGHPTSPQLRARASVAQLTTSRSELEGGWGAIDEPAIACASVWGAVARSLWALAGVGGGIGGSAGMSRSADGAISRVARREIEHLRRRLRSAH